MPLRTTLASQANTSTRNIQLSATRMQKLQEQISTGKRVIRPSDDPAEARRVLNLRSEGLRLDTYSSNIEKGIHSLEYNASIMQNISDLVQKVQVLAMQGTNDTLDQNGRAIIANEIDSILESILQGTNASRAGKYIFSGTDTKTEPFTVTRNSDGEISGVTYNGNREKIEYRIGPGINVQVNQPGEEIFIDNKLLDTIIKLRDDIRRNLKSFIRSGLEKIDSAYNSVLNLISKAGGITSTLKLTSNRVADTKLSVADALASAESVDLAEVIMKLKEQENVFNAALASSAIIFRISILQYI